MKVLSLLQPWASLVVGGHKRIETRSFNTKHRGPLLIHASLGKGYNKLDAKDPLYKHYHRLFAKGLIPPIEKLPFGAIIGSVNLVSTTQFDSKQSDYEGISPTAGGYWDYSEQETAFGDYSPGRWGWLLKDAIEFANPIPCKGDLGIRDILRKSAFAIVEEKEPYEKGMLGRLNTHYLTYYGQKLCGFIHIEEANKSLRILLDNWDYDLGDRSRMQGTSCYWPRILEIEKQLFTPGVASVEQMTASMNC